DKILALPAKTRILLLAPVVRDQKGEFRDVVERLAREGFVRARIDGELVELASNVRIKLEPKLKHFIDVVVDRLVMDEKIRVRLSDSVETALKWGEGRVIVLHQVAEGRSERGEGRTGTSARPSHLSPLTAQTWTETMHSNRNYSPATGESFET